MKTKCLTIICAVGALCLTNASAAADRRPIAVYDTRVHKPHHVLTDPNKLFAKLVNSNLAKSQFETVAAYQARIAHMRPSGEYFITVAPEFTHYVYAAEYQRLVVMCDQSGGSDMTVSTVTHDLGHITMQNAFGNASR